MRPARFFFALLFGAAVLITFFKLLFFALMAAAVFGTLFFAFRAARHFANWRGHPQGNFFPGNYRQPIRLGSYPNEQIVQPHPFQLAENQGVGRHIEVL